VTTTDTSPAGPPTSKAAAPPAQQWTMPNLVGANLQQAQDRIQALTGDKVFFTSSHDATGKGRNQVLDSNWKVCAQNVAAGTPITTDTKIDFGAVKLTENCP
jgi:beta-lactam-binding protein with PASTA domain